MANEYDALDGRELLVELSNAEMDVYAFVNAVDQAALSRFDRRLQGIADRDRPLIIVVPDKAFPQIDREKIRAHVMSASMFLSAIRGKGSCDAHAGPEVAQ